MHEPTDSVPFKPPDDAASRLRERLGRAYLYLVTPANPPAGRLEDLLPRLLEAGVDMVQLREKAMEAGPLLRHCETVRRWTERFGAVFIVNDRVDVAIAAGADGVHLGQDDLTVDEARRQMGPLPVIGLSTHSPAQLNAGLAGGADYVAVGPVFSTPTKPGRPAVGLELVSLAADRAGSAKPVFAIGGIGPGNVAAVVEAGARRISVVRAITESEDPAGAARELRDCVLGSSRRLDQ
ncbi:MAG TPA: thiamine phosphate synthase [Actinomycetota bacterium]|nr:thiamine phosphate synthase [Actinomycetota bacterium]